MLYADDAVMYWKRFFRLFVGVVRCWRLFKFTKSHDWEYSLLVILFFFTLIPCFGKCILEANKEINKCSNHSRKRAIKDLMCECKNYWGHIKLTLLTSQSNIQEEEEEEEGDLIWQRRRRQQQKKMGTKYTKIGSKQGGKVETDLALRSR